MFALDLATRRKYNRFLSFAPLKGIVSRYEVSSEPLTTQNAQWVKNLFEDVLDYIFLKVPISNADGGLRSLKFQDRKFSQFLISYLKIEFGSSMETMNKTERIIELRKICEEVIIAIESSKYSDTSAYLFHQFITESYDHNLLSVLLYLKSLMEKICMHSTDSSFHSVMNLDLLIGKDEVDLLVRSVKIGGERIGENVLRQSFKENAKGRGTVLLIDFLAGVLKHLHEERSKASLFDTGALGENISEFTETSGSLELHWGSAENLCNPISVSDNDDQVVDNSFSKNYSASPVKTDFVDYTAVHIHAHTRSFISSRISTISNNSEPNGIGNKTLQDAAALDSPNTVISLQDYLEEQESFVPEVPAQDQLVAPIPKVEKAFSGNQEIVVPTKDDFKSAFVDNFDLVSCLRNTLEEEIRRMAMFQKTSKSRYTAETDTESAYKDLKPVKDTAWKLVLSVCGIRTNRVHFHGIACEEMPELCTINKLKAKFKSILFLCFNLPESPENDGLASLTRLPSLSADVSVAAGVKEFIRMVLNTSEVKNATYSAFRCREK
eukprot:maker-scaffold_3-snap-gene-15.21-mRNA-1 protein AED:0.00 eAED:0.00 QI:327/1/1/1/1/1/2/406/550